MWSQDEYVTRAKALASAFCAGEGVGGNDLGTLVEKVARDNQLNAEQIRRLSRATNTAVFEAKYASNRGAPDRKVDFNTAEEDVIISRLQAREAPIVSKTASYPDLPNPKARVHEKTAAEIIDTHLMAAPPRVPRWQHLQKLAEELPIELTQLDIRWQSNLRALAEDCRSDGHNHVEFEKNAVAVLGGDVLTELNAVREMLRLSPLAATQEKLAEAAEGFLVGVPCRATRLVSQAREARQEYAKKLAALQVVQQSLPTARKEALGVR